MLRADTRQLFFSGSLNPSRPHFDHEHNTIDLTRLKKTIAQLDPENGPSLDDLTKKHKEKFIKRAKGKGVPSFLFSEGRGYTCLDCNSYRTGTMSREMFQWHTLTK